MWVCLGLALLCVSVDFLSFDSEGILLMYISLSPFKTLWAMGKTATCWLWGIRARHNLHLPSKLCCEIDIDNHLPIYKIWRLDGRYYGALTGLKKMNAVKELGMEVVQACWVSCEWAHGCNSVLCITYILYLSISSVYWNRRNSLKAHPAHMNKDDP